MVIHRHYHSVQFLGELVRNMNNALLQPMSKKTLLSNNTDKSSNQSSSSSVVEKYDCVDEAYFGLPFSAKSCSLKVSNYNQVLAVIAANEKML